jgi:nicotinate-nucleotide adenylyltransferase
MAPRARQKSASVGAVTERRRIALFGGSFNPPHVAHQLVCTWALATARPRLDRLWMVPTFKHPFDKQLVAFPHRVAMCERAAALFGGRVEVSRIEEELGREEASYTLRTVKALQARHPDVDFVLVIGADLVAERVRWHGWRELETLVPFLVVGRAGVEEVDERGVTLPHVSSTDVRERLARGEPVDALVAADVVDYIRAHGLYRS